LRAVASFILAGLAVLLAVSPAGAQCYPGLACPTDQQQQQPGTTPSNPGGSSGNLNGQGNDSGSRSKTGKVEFHFVGPVNPPDDWLALRTLPTLKAGERIMKMPRETLFKVIEKRGEWWFLELQNGQTGWAHNTWIRCCKYLNE
jgi:hypothetical protein